MKLLSSSLLYLSLAVLSSAPGSSLERIERFLAAPSASAVETQDALDRSIDALAGRGGGVLLLPPGMDAGEGKATNSRQGVWRDPPPPAPARSWGREPGVTVIGLSGGAPTILPPQLSGLEISRTLDLPRGQSLPHWGYQPILRLMNVGVNGSDRAGILRMDTVSHNENQTFDVMLWRHNYSQGDNYMFDARFYYMGDVHSCAGDENGVVYAAFVESEVNGFHARVAAWDAATRELTYTAPVKADTLGSGRPVINLNPAKWITEGFVWIVAPSSWTAPPSPPQADPVFQGRSYPTRVEPNAVGVNSLRMGGLIRFPKEAPVGREVVGRYFAVNEPGEHVPGGREIRRWYLIDGFKLNPDGTKDIEIIRHWWGAKAAGAPTLYKPENYSSDGHERRLSYIIAPGVNVYDVSDAVESAQVNPQGSRRILRLAPSPFAGTAVDFAPGDPVEQAIGPDPFKPIAFRSWVWDSVPGVFPAPIFDIANQGAVMRHSVMTVAGGTPNVADRAARHDRNPPWDSYFRFESACNNGIVFNADVAGSAILFEQPNGRAQPIAWRYDGGRKEATLTVSPQDGTMTFDGDGLAVPGGLTSVSGLSGTATPARNLRGIAVAVPSGARRIVVPFQHREADADYAVFIQPNWLTAHAVVSRAESGFTVEFAQPPGSGAHLHWMLVR